MASYCFALSIKIESSMEGSSIIRNTASESIHREYIIAKENLNCGLRFLIQLYCTLYQTSTVQLYQVHATSGCYNTSTNLSSII